MPADGVGGFPNNISLSGFLDLSLATRADPNPIEVALSARKCTACGDDKETRQCVHCDKMVCPLCLRSHLAQMRLGIGHQLTQLRDGLPQLARSLEGQWDESERTSSQVKGVADEINASIDAQVVALRDRQRVLTSELDSFVEEERTEMQSRRETVQQHIQWMHTYCDVTDQTLAGTSESDLVTKQQLCTLYLEKNRCAANTSPPLTRRVTYVEQHVDELYASIARFGHLQFSAPDTTEPLAHTAPDVTMSRIPSPSVFFDPPHDVDSSTSDSSANDQSPPRLDLSPPKRGAFRPNRQEAPPMSTLEQAPLVTTIMAMSPPDLFPNTRRLIALVHDIREIIDTDQLALVMPRPTTT